MKIRAPYDLRFSEELLKQPFRVLQGPCAIKLES